MKNTNNRGLSLPASIAVMGATCTRKSHLAVVLAEAFNGEIISMDSRQVYRGMDIGTAKASKDQRGGIVHHLLDILDPDQEGNAGTHAVLACEVMEQILNASRVPILAGGTGFYFRALFEGLIEINISTERLAVERNELNKRSIEGLYQQLQLVDPARAREVSPNDRVRITRALEVFNITDKPISEHFKNTEPCTSRRPLKIILTMPRFDLRNRIAKRCREMFQAGWIDEVKMLLSSGYSSSSPGMNSLGYREICIALETGRDPRTEIDRIIDLTRQYAKRQETFFRKEQNAVRFDATSGEFPENVITYAARFFTLNTT